MAKETTEQEMYTRAIDGLKQAAGSFHQLAHAQQNPQFLQLRDLLENVREQCITLALRKSVPRQQVLAMLDNRQRKLT